MVDACEDDALEIFRCPVQAIAPVLANVQGFSPPVLSSLPELSARQLKLILQLVKDAWDLAQKVARTAAKQEMNIGIHSMLGLCNQIDVALKSWSGAAGAKKLQAVLSRVGVGAACVSDEVRSLFPVVTILVAVSQMDDFPSTDAAREAVQAATLRVTALLHPHVLKRPSSHFFPGGPAANLFAFVFGGKWRFLTVPCTPTRMQELAVKRLPSWSARSDSEHLSDLMRICIWPCSDGSAIVEEGCTVCINRCNVKSAFEYHRKTMPEKADADIINLILSYDLQLPVTPENLEWVARTVQEPDSIAVVMRRSYGLTHPHVPFPESANPVLIDDPVIINSLFYDILPRLGLSTDDQWQFVPVSFGVSISSADRNLQRAHAHTVRNEDSGEILAAIAEAAREYMVDDMDALAQVADKDMKKLLSHVNPMVRNAMTELHSGSLRQKDLMQEAEAAVIAAFDNACTEIQQQPQLFERWINETHWLLRQGKTPKKGKNRARQKTDCQVDLASRADPEEFITSTAKCLEYQRRKYEHMAKSLASLDASTSSSSSSSSLETRILDLAAGTCNGQGGYTADSSIAVVSQSETSNGTTASTSCTTATRPHTSCADSTRLDIKATCVVCLEKPAELLSRECGHLAWCRGCHREVVRFELGGHIPKKKRKDIRLARTPVLCPVCRVKSAVVKFTGGEEVFVPLFDDAE